MDYLKKLSPRESLSDSEVYAMSLAYRGGRILFHYKIEHGETFDSMARQDDRNFDFIDVLHRELEPNGIKVNGFVKGQIASFINSARSYLSSNESTKNHSLLVFGSLCVYRDYTVNHEKTKTYILNLHLLRALVGEEGYALFEELQTLAFSRFPLNETGVIDDFGGPSFEEILICDKRD